MSRNKQVAEELLQETFYRAMISLKVKNIVQAKAWLFKVARNLYIDSTRKLKSEQRMMDRVQMELTTVSNIGNPEAALEQKSRQEHIEQILEMLPERMQTIIYLREIQAFTYKELAAAMDLTESQVKVILHRARAKFRYYDQILEGGNRNEER